MSHVADLLAARERGDVPTSYPRRSRKARTLRATAYREPGALAANPNSGKRRASSGAAARDIAAAERAKDARRDYRPLTVHTPIARARKAPRTTSYTI